jgi:hypothetical protein
MTGTRTFFNMRAYLHWALRDALDPAFKFDLAIPPCPELEEEISAIHYVTKSNGKIQIQDKDDIKKAIGGRSPDWIDALKNVFYPIQFAQAADDEIIIEA